MPSCKMNIPVDCRLEDAFEYVADYTNFKDFIPMFLETSSVGLVSYGPGTSLKTTVMLGKVEVATTLDLVEFVKNKRIVYKSSSGVKSRVMWEFSQLGRQVLVTWIYDCEVPPGLTRGGSEQGAIEKELHDSAARSMDLLKWILESQAASKDAERL